MVAAAASGLYLLALLACPVSMGLMMVFMGRGMSGGKGRDASTTSSTTSLDDLKADQARLAEQIVRLERETTAAQNGAAPAGEGSANEDSASEPQSVGVQPR